ncbi:MAG: PAS domain S-box protein [Magnetococcales bacterium]|nr:PAS domain S-box protein [Magnetococcales bacterium]
MSQLAALFSSLLKYPVRLGLLFLVLILAGTGLLVIDQMRTLSGLTDHFYRHPFTVSLATMRLRDRLARMHLKLEDVMHGAELQTVERHLASQGQEMEQDLRIIRERFLGEAERVQEVESAIRIWLRVCDKILEAVRTGLPSSTTHAMMLENDRLTQRVIAATQKILDYADHKAISYRQQSTERFQLFLVEESAVILVVILLAVWVASRLSSLLHASEAAHQKTSAVLSEQAILLENIVHMATDMAIIATDSHLVVQLFNPVAERIFGLQAAEVVGESVDQIHERLGIDPERVAAGMKQLRQVGFHRFERRPLPNLAGRIIESRASAILDRMGNEVGFLLISRDVTEQALSTEAIARSEKKFRLLLESAQDAIFVADAETGLIQEANHRAEQLLKRPLHQILGMHQSELHPIGERARYRELFQKQVSVGGGFVGDVLVEDSQGLSIPVEISAGVVDIGGQKVIQGIFRDVTERVRSEQSLRWALDSLTASQARLQGILDHAQAMIFLKDPQTRYLMVNRRFELFLDRPERSVLGCTDRDLFSEATAAQFQANDLRAIEVGSFEVEEAWPHGEGRRTYLSVKFPIKDAQEALLAVCTIATDITERKQMEEDLRRLNEELEDRVQERTLELERSNRDLQQFAYVASHDLQEPLRQVSGFAQLLARRYQGRLDEKADKFIGYMVDGTRYMQELIEALLSFSRVNTDGNPLQSVDCEQVLAQVMKNMAKNIKNTNAVITHDPLPTLQADLFQMNQIFQNLLANAIKFRGENPPHIHIGVERHQGDWLFSVQDNGIGIEPRHQERIFTIFQRLHTRVQYPGTGIGLSICKRIVERHGGEIWVKSESGQGSTFFFTIKHDPILNT